MSSRGKALLAFMRKELRHVLRDPQTLWILLLVPLAQVVVFGFALRSDVNDIRIAFVEPVSDQATAELRTRFQGNDRFTVVGVLPSVQEVEPLFRRGKADLALVFAPGFAQEMARGTPARLHLISDATDPNSGSMRQAYARAVVSAYQAEAAARGRASSQPFRIEVRSRMRYNPALESVNLFVPGLIALVLTLVTALMTAISLSREKERGTLEVLLVSPLRPWQIIVGKVVPYLFLAMVNVVSALLAAWLVFRVPFRGSLTLLLSASVLYAMVGLALGVLIAARTTSQRAAMLGAMVGTMLPSTLLSGMIFPISSLPDWLRPLTVVVPARWFIVISRGVMLKGAGLENVWMELLVLSVMLTVFMVAAVRSFSPRLT